MSLCSPPEQLRHGHSVIGPPGFVQGMNVLIVDCIISKRYIENHKSLHCYFSTTVDGLKEPFLIFKPYPIVEGTIYPEHNRILNLAGNLLFVVGVLMVPDIWAEFSRWTRGGSPGPTFSNNSCFKALSTHPAHHRQGWSIKGVTMPLYLPVSQ